MLQLNELVRRLRCLVLYGNICKDPVFEALEVLSKHMDAIAWHTFVSRLVHCAEEECLSGNIFKKYIVLLFLRDENIFAMACENKTPNLQSSGLYQIAAKDIDILNYVLNFDMKKLCKEFGFDHKIIYHYIPQKKPVKIGVPAYKGMFAALIRYYSHKGCGQFARNRFFEILDGEVCPIRHADTVQLEDIIGYEEQKQMLIANTEAFLAGRPANHVLLAGARGTGKSSCVKALANTYFDKKLRVIKAEHREIKVLKGLFKTLRERGLYFIIFLDDVSYESTDAHYVELKTLLEGDPRVCPSNILFYATSNRRHLVKETWSDRAAATEEVHASDVLNEKLSLSDRFGLSITFPKPNPQQYLDIVRGIAMKEELDIPESFLNEAAKQWELNQKGLSGRTARQFVNQLITDGNQERKGEMSYEH